MNKEDNFKRMIQLQGEIVGMHAIAGSFVRRISSAKAREFLEKQCEYNVRSVINKYFNCEELTGEDYDVISQYLFFSDRDTYAGKAEGPNEYDMRLKSTYGSGDFTEEEIEVIRTIKEQRNVNARTM